MATPVAKSSQPTSGGSRDSKSSYSRTEPGSGCLLPEAQEAEFPALLDSPAPRLRTYPKETVVAEKLEAMVKLGMANSRMKDFYDLVVLCTRFDFDGIVLSRAIRATFERRATPLPTDLPLALTPMFTTDPTKKTQWAAFLRKTGIHDADSMESTAGAISSFVGPLLSAVARGNELERRWVAGGPWTSV